MPHPCALDPDLPGCAKLALDYAAEKMAGTAPAEAVSTLHEALVANAPMLTERLNNAMVQVGVWVEASENFAVEQMPLLVKEIIYFEIADNGFWVLLGMFMILWGIFAYRWSLTRAKERMGIINKHTKLLEDANRDKGNYSADTTDVVFSVAHYGIPGSGVVSSILGLIFIMNNFMDVVKPIVAPRLFLIEYFRQLVQ